MKTLPISLCMIVKNEEKHLNKCLSSINKMVNEMIIVDTGSTDNTIEIARNYTDNIYHYDWDDHFGRARNHALSFAKNPWILQLDADEYLPDESKPWFYTSYPWPGTLGYQLSIENTRSETAQDIFIAHKAIRFFRNTSFIKYQYAIHEIVKINPDKRSDSEARIIHTGYADQSKKKTRLKRNKKLLDTELNNNPQDPYWYANMALFYGSQQNFNKADECARQALEWGIQNPLRRHCLRLILEYALRSKNRERFHWIADQTTAYKFPELLYYEAEFTSLDSDKKKALKKYKAFLDSVERLPETTISERILTDNICNAYIAAGKLYQESNKLKTAIAHFEKAFTWCPSRIRTQISLAELYFQQESYAKALNQYETISKKLKQTNLQKNRLLIENIDKLVTQLRLELKTSNYHS